MNLVCKKNSQLETKAELNKNQSTGEYNVHVRLSCGAKVATKSRETKASEHNWANDGHKSVLIEIKDQSMGQTRKQIIGTKKQQAGHPMEYNVECLHIARVESYLKWKRNIQEIRDGPECVI